jgi:hypothetical protein
MRSLLDDPECVAALLPHLPEGSQTPAELRATVSVAALAWSSLIATESLLSFTFSQLRSPQLRQSIGSLVSALQTGNFNAVMANFGLDPSAGAAKLAFGDGKLRGNLVDGYLCVRPRRCSVSCGQASVRFLPRSKRGQTNKTPPCPRRASRPSEVLSPSTPSWVLLTARR